MQLSDYWKLRTHFGLGSRNEFEYGCPTQACDGIKLLRINPDGTGTILIRQDQMRKKFAPYLQCYKCVRDGFRILQRKNVWYLQDCNGTLHILERGLTINEKGEVIPEPQLADWTQVIIDGIYAAAEQKISELKTYYATHYSRSPDIGKEVINPIWSSAEKICNDILSGKHRLPKKGLWQGPKGIIHVYGEIRVSNRDTSIAVLLPNDESLLCMSLDEFWQEARRQDWQKITQS
jgi:hypothetical protein